MINSEAFGLMQLLKSNISHFINNEDPFLYSASWGGGDFTKPDAKIINCLILFFKFYVLYRKKLFHKGEFNVLSFFTEEGENIFICKKRITNNL